MPPVEGAFVHFEKLLPGVKEGRRIKKRLQSYSSTKGDYAQRVYIDNIMFHGTFEYKLVVLCYWLGLHPLGNVLRKYAHRYGL